MSQFNASAYNVQKPTGQCALTGRRLEPGERYIATLIDTPEGGLQRLDVAPEAWDRGERPEQMIAHWKAVAPEPEQKQKLFVDDEVLMNLLHRLADAEEPQRVAFRFVLTLILMRKKLLRYDRTERREATDADGNAAQRDWWILTPKLDLTKGPNGKWDEQTTVEVLDPHLDEEGIRQVTDQLSQILQAEL